MSIRSKALKGSFWGGLNDLLVKALRFIIGIILARLLLPEEFGLLGMVMVFFVILEPFIDGGFSIALIRKKECSEIDYSTMFIFNFIVAISLYLLLFLLAPYISSFLEEPRLNALLRVVAFKIVIDALYIVKTVRIVRNLDFKKQAKINISAVAISGSIGILLALNSYGVWSLVAQVLLLSIINCTLYWFLVKNKVDLRFSRESFWEQFNFGSKLLGSSLLGRIYNQLSSFLIGKYFSFSDLGFYTRANSFKELPSSTLNTVITKITFPILSKSQDDDEVLLTRFKKVVLLTTFLSFFIMTLLAIISDEFIIILVGSKWESSVLLFKILSIAGMLYPLQALNMMMLNVKGRTDIHLKSTLIKNIVALPILFASLYYDLIVFVSAVSLIAIIHYIMNVYYANKVIDYKITSQLKDILPQSFLIILAGFLAYQTSYISSNIFITLILKSISYLLLVIFVGETFHFYAYKEIKNIALGIFKLRS